MDRKQKVEVGQRVHWQYPHDDIPGAPGEFIVVKPYPVTSGSGTYVRVAKEMGGEDYPALPEELTLLPPPPAPAA